LSPAPQGPRRPARRAVIVYDAIIDNDRRADAGFRDSYAQPLAGPDSMVVGIK